MASRARRWAVAVAAALWIGAAGAAWAVYDAEEPLPPPETEGLDPALLEALRAELAPVRAECRRLIAAAHGHPEEVHRLETACRRELTEIEHRFLARHQNP